MERCLLAAIKYSFIQQHSCVSPSYRARFSTVSVDSYERRWSSAHAFMSRGVSGNAQKMYRFFLFKDLSISGNGALLAPLENETYKVWSYDGKTLYSHRHPHWSQHLDTPQKLWVTLLATRQRLKKKTRVWFITKVLHFEGLLSQQQNFTFLRCSNQFSTAERTQRSALQLGHTGSLGPKFWTTPLRFR